MRQGYKGLTKKYKKDQRPEEITPKKQEKIDKYTVRALELLCDPERIFPNRRQLATYIGLKHPHDLYTYFTVEELGVLERKGALERYNHMMKDVFNVLQKMRDEALKGDTQAARIYLDRMLGPANKIEGSSPMQGAIEISPNEEKKEETFQIEFVNAKEQNAKDKD